jgi:hypothetical protein
VVFQDRRKTGRLDLEATEMAVRAALHRAGARALSQLLQFPAPNEEGRTVACPCGQQAHYHQLRTKSVLTVVGPAEVSRPYYWCPTLSGRSISRRCRTGHGEHTILEKRLSTA